MLNWLRKYWPVLVIVLLMVTVIDGTFSSLLTCHPVGGHPSGGSDPERAKEYCTALGGPILTTLGWVGRITHEYEGLITAAFTIALAVFTGRLWFSTDKLWGATAELVEGAKDTAQKQLRAYISVASARITHIEDGEGVPEAHIFIKNFGQTPAYQVMGVAGFAISTFPPPPDLNLVIPDVEIIQSKTITNLGPGQADMAIASPRPKLDRPFTEHERAELANGIGTIYIYGKVRYRDVFGTIQWMSYRFMVGGPVGVRGDQLVGCEEGNEAT
jgi:hypothetical protein